MTVDGSSDDLDIPIKLCFQDHAFTKRHNLSSINSINWARIMVQTVHYIYAYLQVLVVIYLICRTAFIYDIPVYTCAIISIYKEIKSVLVCAFITVMQEIKNRFYLINCLLFTSHSKSFIYTKNFVWETTLLQNLLGFCQTLNMVFGQTYHSYLNTGSLLKMHRFDIYWKKDITYSYRCFHLIYFQNFTFPISNRFYLFEYMISPIPLAVSESGISILKSTK